MTHYIALIHKDRASIYGVSFPDVPGIIAAADTLDDALSEAAEALAFAAEDWEAHSGDPFPRPRSLDALRDDPQFKKELPFLARFARLGKARRLARGSGEVAVTQTATSAFAQHISLPMFGQIGHQLPFRLRPRGDRSTGSLLGQINFHGTSTGCCAQQRTLRGAGSQGGA